MNELIPVLKDWVWTLRMAEVVEQHINCGQLKQFLRLKRTALAYRCYKNLDKDGAYTDDV